MVNVMDTQGEEVKEFNKKVEDTFNQFFIDTTSSSLERWEKELGIPVNNKKTDDYRRRIIKSKLRGRGTFTKSEARSLANTFSYEKISEFIQIQNEYAFKTRYYVDDLIDYDGLRKAFEEMKPAHLLHIIGLLESVDINIDISKLERINIVVKVLLGKDIVLDHTYRYRLKAEVVGYSVFNPNTVETLYLNGAWKMNGDKLLDALNHDGIMLYIKQADDLHIKLKNRIETDQKMNSDIKVILRLNSHHDLKAVMEKKKIIRQNVDTLCFTENNPPTIEGLYLNGAWRLDGLQSLDGVNHDGVSLYARQFNNLYVKVKAQVNINLEMDTTLETILGLYKDYNLKTVMEKKEIIRQNVDTLCFTKNNPPTIEGLYLNGAWRLNGLQKLDGTNSLGIQLYTSTADILTVKITKDDTEKEAIVIDY